jgi:uncharacterized protein YgiM (DUF1202 family)
MNSIAFFTALSFLGLAVSSVQAMDSFTSTAVIMSVQVEKSPIRTSPSVTSPVIGWLKYRTKVALLGYSSTWALVQVPGKEDTGYMFLSALTMKTIPDIASDTTTSGLQTTELALAGKGFSSKIEDQLKSLKNLDYSKVNEMESFRYDPAACVLFIEGHDNR